MNRLQEQYPVNKKSSLICQAEVAALCCRSKRHLDKSNDLYQAFGLLHSPAVDIILTSKTDAL